MSAKNIHAWGKLFQTTPNGQTFICGGSLDTLEHVQRNILRKDPSAVTTIVLD